MPTASTKVVRLATVKTLGANATSRLIYSTTHSMQANPNMRDETIAIHGGYEPDPTTKAVAVPIYQTVAYAFDSADHGAVQSGG